MINENIYLPDDMPKAEGRVKLELFDKTGRRVRKEEGHNFITLSPKVLSHMFYLKQFGRPNFSDPIDLYKELYLTDATHGESIGEDYFIKGMVIGYADTRNQEASDNEYRGTLNNEESFVNERQRRIVVDFPTSAANGEISSVYFAQRDQRSILSSSMFFEKLCPDLESVHLKTAIQGPTVTHVLLKIENDNTRYLQIDNVSREIVKDVPQFGQFIKDIAIIGTRLYRLYERWGGGNVKWCPLSDVGEPGESWTEVISVGSPFALHYEESSDKLYVYSDNVRIRVYDGTSHLLLNEVDQPNGHVLSDGNTSGLQGGRGDRRTIKIGDNHIIAGAFQNGAAQEACVRIRFDETTNTITKLDAGLIRPIQGFFDGKIVDYDGKLIPKAGLGSRYLLNQPVVKTSQYTMKVTYDFMLPAL